MHLRGNKEKEKQGKYMNYISHIYIYKTKGKRIDKS